VQPAGGEVEAASTDGQSSSNFPTREMTPCHLVLHFCLHFQPRFMNEINKNQSGVALPTELCSTTNVSHSDHVRIKTTHKVALSPVPVPTRLMASPIKLLALEQRTLGGRWLCLAWPGVVGVEQSVTQLSGPWLPPAGSRGISHGFS
jgi:hypothetical protein